MKIRGDAWPRFLFPANSKPHTGPKVDWQRGISNHLVVATVESILDVCVGRDVRIYRVPSAYVGADIAGGVINIEAQEVGVGAGTDETSA